MGTEVSETIACKRYTRTVSSWAADNGNRSVRRFDLNIFLAGIWPVTSGMAPELLTVLEGIGPKVPWRQCVVCAAIVAWSFVLPQLQAGRAERDLSGDVHGGLLQSNMTASRLVKETEGFLRRYGAVRGGESSGPRVQEKISSASRQRRSFMPSAIISETWHSSVRSPSIVGRSAMLKAVSALPSWRQNER